MSDRTMRKLMAQNTQRIVELDAKVDELFKAYKRVRDEMIEQGRKPELKAIIARMMGSQLKIMARMVPEHMKADFSEETAWAKAELTRRALEPNQVG